jgi:hypothetical protein
MLAMDELQSASSPTVRSRIAGVISIVVFALSLIGWIAYWGPLAVVALPEIFNEGGGDVPGIVFGVFCIGTVPFGLLLAPIAVVATLLVGPRWPWWLRIGIAVPPVLVLIVGPAIYVIEAIRYYW